MAESSRATRFADQALPVFLGVLLRCVLMMVGGMQGMPVSHLGVMRRFFVISGLVMLGGFVMVLGRMLMVMRGLLMVLVDIVTVHRSLPCGLLRCKGEASPGSMKHLRRFDSCFPSA
jgi:hypothetical protein